MILAVAFTISLLKSAKRALLAVVIVHAATAAGQPPQTEPRYRVLIHRTEATGTGETLDTAYVPEAFYDALNGLASKANRKPRGWLITDAFFDVTIARDSTGSIFIDGLSVQLNLHVLQRTGIVNLPLDRKLLMAKPIGVKLDGVEADYRIDEVAGLFRLEAVQPGFRQLTLSYRFPIEGNVSSNEFDFLIPKIPRGTLHLHLPSELGNVTIPSAIIPPASKAGGREMVANLMPTERLAAQWTTGRNQLGNGPLSVEEWVWIKIQDGSVQIDSRIVCEPQDGAVREIVLEIDPKLQLLAVDPGDVQYRVVRDTAEPDLVRLVLAEALTQPTVVPVRMLVSESTGLGTTTLPHVRVRNSRTSRRFLAVSVAPGMTYKINASRHCEPMRAARFVELWKENLPPPNAAFHLFSLQAEWSITAYPGEPVMTVLDTETVVICDARHVKIESSSHFSVEQGYSFQQSLRAAAGFDVESVRLTAPDGSELLARMVQTDDGLVTLHLTTPLEGEHVLQLKGSLALSKGSDFAVPLLDFVDGGGNVVPQNHRISLFRQPACTVDIVKAAGLDAVTQNVHRYEPHRGRLMAEFLRSDTIADLTLRIRRNMPEVNWEQVSVVTLENERWAAEIHASAKVKKGIVDVLTWELNQPGEFEFIQADANARAFDVSRFGDATVISIVPTTAIDDHYSVSFRALSSKMPHESFQVPDVQPVTATVSRRFLVLPHELQNERITWDTYGVREFRGDVKNLPSELFAADAHLLEIADSASRVEGYVDESQPGQPQITLAQFCVDWHEAGFTGVASFDLLPAGHRRCKLICPKDCEILGVFVEGESVSAGRFSGTITEIPLLSQQLPQRVEVVFSAHGGPLRSSRFLCPLPALATVAATSSKRIPAAGGTLFAVRGQLPLVMSSPYSEPVTYLGWSASRLHHMNSGLRELKLLADNRQQRIWASRWLTRLNRAIRQVSSSRNEIRSADREVSPILNTENAEITTSQLRRWLADATSAFSRGAENPDLDWAIDSSELWELQSSETESISYFQLTDLPRQVEFAAHRAPSSALRVAGTLVSLLAVAACVYFQLPRFAADIIRQWPHALMAILGGVYLAAFPASLLAFLAIFGVAWLSTRVVNNFKPHTMQWR